MFPFLQICVCYICNQLETYFISFKSSHLFTQNMYVSLFLFLVAFICVRFVYGHLLTNDAKIPIWLYISHDHAAYYFANTGITTGISNSFITLMTNTSLFIGILFGLGFFVIQIFEALFHNIVIFMIRFDNISEFGRYNKWFDWIS